VRNATQVEPFHIQLESLGMNTEKPIPSRKMPFSRNLAKPVKTAPISTEVDDNKRLPQVNRAYVAVERGLHIRKSPWGPVITTLSFNEPVALLSNQGQWSMVRVGEQIGYAFKSYLGKGPQPSIQRPGRVRERRAATAGIEVPGVRVISQNTRDPFDESGTRGKFPAGYCGPASLQMVLDYYGVHRSRDFLALTDVGQGKVYKKGRGSAYGPMVFMSRYLGFDETEVVWSQSLEPLIERLKLGRPQIVSLRGQLKFKWGGRNRRTKGHIVVVIGITGSGEVIMHDPAGMGERKLMAARDFQSVWRGFMVDVKQGDGQPDSDAPAVLSHGGFERTRESPENLL